jgi:basic amino acid/polyamine antiporter, APA family
MVLALDHVPETAADDAEHGNPSRSVTAAANRSLHRAIRTPGATALVVGIIVGASIFVQPSEVTARVPSIVGVLCVWAGAGALTFAGARVCAEFATIIPDGGGVYSYLRNAYGPWLGFLWGWAMFWTMHTGIIAAIAVIFARYTATLLPMGPTASTTIAIGVVVFLSAINYLGVKQASRLQTVFTAAKLLAIVAIVVIGVAFGGRVPEHFVGPVAPHPFNVGDYFAGLAAGLFAFGGWHMVSYSAGETVDPERTIPRALLLGTVIVTGAYVALNAVYLYILPLDQAARSPHIAADLAAALLGPGAGRMIALVVMLSSFGALAGVILTGPRVYLAMAQDRQLFVWVGKVHSRYRTPSRAIMLQAIWAAVLIATGTFRVLFTRVVYTEWLFFGMLALGLLRMRSRRATPTIVILLFAAMAFAIAIHQIVVNPKDAFIGLGLVLSGIPVYYLIVRRRTRLEPPTRDME